MNVFYINAITTATKEIMKNYFGLEVTPLQPKTDQNPVLSNYVSVILGFSGDLDGQIICSFSEDTAKKLVGIMMGGMEVTVLDDMAWSAVQEFGNWIAGTTATELSKGNCYIDVTPPIINEGSSNFRTTKTFITVPIDSLEGEIDIHITVNEEN